MILKTILPFESVHVAGLGLGTITTVAQVPVPALQPEGLTTDTETGADIQPPTTFSLITIAYTPVLKLLKVSES